MIKLPKHCPDEDATTLAEKLGQLSRGIVPTLLGWAVRVRKLDQARERNLLDPELALDVGDEL